MLKGGIDLRICKEIEEWDKASSELVPIGSVWQGELGERLKVVNLVAENTKGNAGTFALCSSKLFKFLWATRVEDLVECYRRIK